MCVRKLRLALSSEVHVYLHTFLSALTDPLISGIANGSKAYKLVGTYVTTPLNWCVTLTETFGNLSQSSRAVITGKNSKYNSITDLKDTTIGISRVGR
jgi:hypothetical protein